MRDKLISILGDKIQYGVGYSAREDYPFTPEGGGGGGVIGHARYFLGDIADHLLVHGVTVQEWVSVEDALPDDGEYLVRVKFAGRSFTMIASFAHSSQTLNEIVRYGVGDKQDFWYLDDCEYGVGEQMGVTHWMKLPAPPKEE